MSKKNKLPKLPGDFVRFLKPIVNYGDVSGCLFERVYIKEVIYNNPATIVMWSDDTKTVAKCNPADKYNPEFGLMWCILKKFYKNSAIRDTMKYWCPGRCRVTLSDVRKKIKEEKKK